MKVKVNAGWQLGVEGGKLAYEGDTLDVPDALAEEWINGGRAVAAKAVAKPKKAKAVKASKNKAVVASANKAVELASKPSFVSTPTVVDTPGPIVPKG